MGRRRLLTATATGALGVLAGGRTVRAAPPPLSLTEKMPKAGNLGINEAFKALPFGTASGAGWTRWTVQWFNVQPNPSEFNTFYFTDSAGKNTLDEQIAAGMKVAAMVLGTPEWAAETPGIKTGTSVPKGLNEPVFVNGAINPQNTWGAFMFKLAAEYAGRMDVFEIWNEVEIPTTGSNAVYNTWAGSAAQYYDLLRVASEAAKAANPTAKIVTSPYSYFRDKDAGGGDRLAWFEEFAAIVKTRGADVFDIVALNLYRNAHDLWDRYHGSVPIAAEAADRKGFRTRLDEIGATGTPIWLTEINAMPYDDPMPGWNTAPDGFRITLEEQAHYVVQAHALALAAGYQAVFFQALQDDPYPVPDELWGLVRFEGNNKDTKVSRARPAFFAYRVVGKYLGDADRAELWIRKRPDPKKLAMYASRYEWAHHLVVFSRGDQRASVVWNGTSETASVSIAPAGGSAILVDSVGNERPLAPDSNGMLTVELPPATRHFDLFDGDPAGYFYIGGPTFVIVERGVAAGAPVEAKGFERQTGQ